MVELAAARGHGLTPSNFPALQKSAFSSSENSSFLGDKFPWCGQTDRDKWNSHGTVIVFTGYGQVPKRQALRVVCGCPRQQIPKSSACNSSGQRDANAF